MEVIDDDIEPRPEQHLIAHVDGGSRGNPGPAGYGVVIRDSRGNTVARLSDYVGERTCNEVEYLAVLAAQRFAVNRGASSLRVLTDSELVVKQVRREYAVKDSRLVKLYHRARTMVGQIPQFCISWIPKTMNAEADRLAAEAITGAGT